MWIIQGRLIFYFSDYRTTRRCSGEYFNRVIFCGKWQLFHSQYQAIQICCIDVPHVCDHNSKGSALIKKSKTCGPPPLVTVSGETHIASIWKAVSARRRLLYQTNYKNIILEMLFLSYKRANETMKTCWYFVPNVWLVFVWVTQTFGKSWSFWKRN